jgi:catechol 2,3-dioxygenase-like lactoylglutathione lyase family enzyme
MVGAHDLAASKKFYDAVLGAIGLPAGQADPKGRIFYRTKTGVFGITKPIDGQPATHANGGTIGFACASPEQARAFHDAGVANGGKSIEDPPGWREGPSKFYLAYLRDPSGNKICALHRGRMRGSRTAPPIAGPTINLGCGLGQTRHIQDVCAMSVFHR